MDNPYLGEFLQLVYSGLDSSKGRKELRRKYAYAIPSREALEAIAIYSPIIEVGAGGGYWAWCLAARGVDIIATDTAAPRDNRTWFGGEESWHEVIVMDGPEAAKCYSDRALFLCWPIYAELMAYETIKSYVEAGGSILIYIGEGFGGCTGSDTFFEFIWEVLTEIRHIPLPQWYGLHDNLWIYQVDTKRK